MKKPISNPAPALVDTPPRKPMGRVLGMSVPGNMVSPQLQERQVDSTGRRIRPAALALESRSEAVLRDVQERHGDIISVAKKYSVGCNDVGRLLVKALKIRNEEAA